MTIKKDMTILYAIIIKSISINFIMFEAKYQTPNRRKSTIDETYTDKRLKSSNVDSSCSRDAKLRKGMSFIYAEIINWQNYEHRRDSRINSMLKIRKEKLVEIT